MGAIYMWAKRRAPAVARVAQSKGCQTQPGEHRQTDNKYNTTTVAICCHRYLFPLSIFYILSCCYMFNIKII